MTWLTTIIAVIPGVAALLGLILSRRQNAATATKTEAEAAEVIQGAALALLEPLQKRVKELESELYALRQEVHETRIENQQARRLLEENGIPLP